MSTLAALKQAVEKIEQARAEATKQAKETLGPALQQFLKDNPEVKSVAWSQYTPYFNDGEPCVFRIQGIYFMKIELEDFNFDVLEGDEQIRTWRKEDGVSESTYNACVELEKMLGGAEEVLEAVFGDHVYVIVTNKGVDVQEYEHD